MKYVAPEITDSKRKKTVVDKGKSEIYSLGVIFYLVLSMKFPNPNCKDHLEQIKRQKGVIKELYLLIN